jgi:hypothetical protein
MNSLLAKRLSEEGAFFMLIDFPLGSSIGIDMNEYTVGEKFLGFKMIPKGLHFINYSCASSKDMNQKAPRSGFFYTFKPQEVVIKKWDAVNEDISEERLSDEDIKRYESNRFGSLDSYLAPYPFEEYHRWTSLIDYITPHLVSKLNPKLGTIRSVPVLLPLKYPQDKISETKSANSASTARNLDDLLPKMEAESNSVINFTCIPKVRYPKGSNPCQITKHSIDSTYILESVLIQDGDDYESFLGEFQFSFVTFLIGQVYESFEQWKTLLRIICTSDEALEKHPQLYLNFIRVIHFQLKEVPADVFVDILEKNNFLTHNLREFFYNVNSNRNIDQKLLQRASKFKLNVTKKFKWDFDLEPDDECPIIVQMD